MSVMTNQELIQTFANKIKRARIRRELTQQDVATRSGVSLNTIAQLEAGGNSSLSTVMSVLRVLQLEKEILAAMPDDQISPLEALKHKSSQRQRVRK
jgi:transcriptional regulator with XRE-family HTH domain